jgi:2-polyprenyl-3-methyl-5-hydroxy-6-metoxy-1,4-benzoquinol methylase
MKKSNCETCRSADIYPVYRLDRIPAFQNKLFSTPAAAQEAPAAAVELCACPHCDFVFNTHFNDSLMDYDSDYQNAQDHSPNFKAHLDDIAALVTKGISPEHKVAEIGCGKGFFLEVLKSRGIHATGFDPAYEGDNPDIIKSYFNKDTAKNFDADVVIMRHTLEHIESPHTFLLNMKGLLKKDARIFIEIPRLEWIVEHRAFWDIFHEHCNYFSEDFFQGIFNGKAKIHRVFDGQYMLVNARLSDLAAAPAIKQYPKRPDLFQGEISKFSRLLSGFRRNYLWGAGAKGIAFANILDPEKERVTSLVDINPKKQDRFISLTGHACHAPAAIDWAALDEKDCLWIMNARYKDEILKSLPPLKCRVIALGEEHDIIPERTGTL